MATDSITVYLGKELYEKVNKAREENGFDPNKVAKEGIERALAGAEIGVGAANQAGAVALGAPVPPPETATLNGGLTIAPVPQDAVIQDQIAAEQYDYKFQYVNTAPDLQAYLDMVGEQGGWVISVAPDIANRYLVIAGWAKQ